MRYNKIGNGDNIRLLFSVALVLVTTPDNIWSGHKQNNGNNV